MDNCLKTLLNTNLLPLAFLGDSVHTLFVRSKLLSCGYLKPDNLNKQASFYCKAASQAKSLEKIMPLLSEEELNILRRARNAKPKHHAKNASLSDYSLATAFEALIGYLYLKDKDRLEDILEKSMEIRDE